MIILVEFQRCNDIRRGQTCDSGGHFVDYRRHIETALTQDEDYQSKVEQTNFRQKPVSRRRSLTKHEDTAETRNECERFRGT